MEIEDDKKQLGLLDVSITNSMNGMYEFQVYRKDVITNVQTKPHSSINPKIFPGVFKVFLVRASHVCSSQHFDKEIDFLSSLRTDTSEMILKELLLRFVTNALQESESHRQYKKRNQLSSSLGFQVYL